MSKFWELNERSDLSRRGFTLGDVIGEGNFSKVFKATYVNAKKQSTILACKRIEKSTSSDFVEGFLPREIRILSKVKHPNIIEVHSLFNNDKYVWIFMRFAEKGSLLDFLDKNGILNESRARFWFSQAVAAVKHLHSLCIAHRDLKCENLLITANLNIKLCDFGFSREFKSKDDFKTMTNCGSIAYSSPELIKTELIDSMKCDVWALGVILFIMLDCNFPFDTQDPVDIKKLLESQMNRRYKLQDKNKKRLSVNCLKVIDALLDPNPSTRPNMIQVSTMEWLSKYCN